MEHTPSFFTVWSLSVLAMAGIHFLWIKVVAWSFYQRRLELVRGHMNWLAAVLFIMVCVAGLTFFATYPTLLRGTLPSGIILGGLYGCVVFGVHNLMNLATVRQWPLLVAIADTVWGTILSAAVVVIMVLLYSTYLTGL
jgi:uncharacterized membrane protein